MALTYITVTETFTDGTGQPLNASVTFIPSEAVYAGASQIATPAAPIVAKVVGGALQGPNGGALQLLANVQPGLTLLAGTGFWWWTVVVQQAGQPADSWSFQLATTPSSVDLYSTKNSPAAGSFLTSKTGSTSVPAAALTPQVVALTDAATVLVNAALGNDFRLLTTSAVGATRAIAAPSNPSEGQVIVFGIQQDSVGSRLVTWTSGAGGFSFGSGTAPTLSTAANALDWLAFKYHAGKNLWCFQGTQLGF